MATGQYRFDRFRLDGDNRLLTADGAPVELNARYLDALVLLVREAGKLVSKDRFLEEVWRGVPVTDEALTQCIRTLRRQLGDDAARPRFIETVPKHGYRFIAPLESGEAAVAPAPPSPIVTPAWRQAPLTVAAGVAGGDLPAPSEIERLFGPARATFAADQAGGRWRFERYRCAIVGNEDSSA